MKVDFLLSCKPTRMSTVSPELLVFVKPGLKKRPVYFMAIRDGLAGFKEVGDDLAISEVISRLKSIYGPNIREDLENDCIASNIFYRHAELMANLSEVECKSALFKLKTKIAQYHAIVLREFGYVVPCTESQVTQPLKNKLLQPWVIQTPVIFPSGLEASVTGEYTPDPVTENGWHIKIFLSGAYFRDYLRYREPIREALERMASSTDIALEDQLLLA